MHEGNLVNIEGYLAHMPLSLGGRDPKVHVQAQTLWTDPGCLGEAWQLWSLCNELQNIQQILDTATLGMKGGFLKNQQVIIQK